MLFVEKKLIIKKLENQQIRKVEREKKRNIVIHTLCHSLKNIFFKKLEEMKSLPHNVLNVQTLLFVEKC